MDFNNDFYQEFMSIKTKPPVSSEGFDSQWEFLKATSYYHYDPQIEDQRLGTCENPLYIPLANFQGDWSRELEMISSMAQPWTPQVGKKQGIPVGEPNLDDYHLKRNYFEDNDLWRWGYTKEDRDYTALSRVRATVGSLAKIVDMFHFSEVWAKCDIQLPGQMFYYHTDNFGIAFDGPTARGNYERPADCDWDQRKWLRLIMFLTDQDHGHVWQQGNINLRWKKGDCFSYPWRDIPHGTANFGHRPRATLNITGAVSDRTLEVLKNFPKTVNVADL